jgi:hypothetical protein
MRCAVMQPTYFPWAGYFNLIKVVDVFVFLDDAQYERSSWQNRNRVLVGGMPHWLTVPVVRDHLGDTLDRVRTDEKLPWRRKHVALLKQTYGNHPFGADALMLTESLISDHSLGVLADLNIRIIGSLCDKLGIATPRLRASELDVAGKRTDRLIKICARLKCDEYLSPPGALQYLAKDGFSEKASARLLINDYQPEPYEQRGSKDFVSHLSIIDIVAHLGWEKAAQYTSRPARATAPITP